MANDESEAGGERRPGHDTIRRRTLRGIRAANAGRTRAVAIDADHRLRGNRGAHGDRPDPT